MSAPRVITYSPNQSPDSSLLRVARFPGMRALAWSGDQLYAARGYQLLRARLEDPSNLKWEPVAIFRPELKRRLTVSNRITARLFRDGFHALAVLPTGGLIAAVAGAIVSMRPQQTEFCVAHTITRGTRPLHITALPNDLVYWGEYFDNSARDEVHIYRSSDGENWEIAYTFPRGAIRHVHNVVYDPWEDCLWVLTGDYGDECRILQVDCKFNRVETVLQGNQQARAVALVPMSDGLFFSSDTPLESNFIYCLDRTRKLIQLSPISSSSIYGCRVGAHVFFSTMVEPSQVNRDLRVRIYGSQTNPQDLRPLLEWRKDAWPLGLFQYGNAVFPDGNNTTPYLALTAVAVRSEDLVTSIYRIRP